MARHFLVAALLCGITMTPAMAEKPLDRATDKQLDRATDKDTSAQVPQFDSRIDSWCQGEITALDLNAKKITLRCAEMPIASVNAQMLKDLHDKTANITDVAQRQQKEAEVRQSWQAKLDKANTESPAAAKETTFKLADEQPLAIVPANAVASVDYLHRDKLVIGNEKSDLGAPVVQNNEDTSKALTLNDLHIGDKVMIGYDSGIFTNDAHALVRLQQSNQSAPTPAK